MKKLSFIKDNGFFFIFIDGEEIWYGDKLWNKGIRLIPRDENINAKIIMSRNKFPNWVSSFSHLTAEEIKEYEENKDSEDKLAAIVIKDVTKVGGKLISTE